jgi:hypothetical protein
MNPARRSCKTCEHEGGWSGERECEADVPGDIDPLDEFNVAPEDANQIAVNCKYWEPSKWRFPLEPETAAF